METDSGHLLSIAFRIVIVGGMKRLMHVADNVQEEFEREKPPIGAGTRIGQLARELLDFVRRLGSSKQAAKRNGLQQPLLYAAFVKPQHKAFL